MIIRLAVILFLSTFLYVHSFAQSTNNFMIGAGFDLYKTDNEKNLDKIQAGLEVNFFVIRKFSVTGGVEFWTFREESFVFGSRYYFIDNFFTRFRALIGENDFSAGIGGAIPLKNNLRLEIIGDYYFKDKEFALRTGLAYIIRTR